MRPTTPGFDGSIIVVAMARDLELRLASMLAGDHKISLATLTLPLQDFIASLEAQAAGRGAAGAIPIGAMIARLNTAIREVLESGDEAKLSLPQRGAAWRLGAELVRIARELPQLLQAPMIFVAEHAFGAGGLHARKLRLANGLQAILVRDPSAPLAAYQTWFRVGSRNEREGKTGIAHLFEHLMFNQTEHLAPGEFDRKLETVGADTNAATWVDWTYYRENVPRQHLELVAELEADRMAHLVVHDPQIASEREVVANERRLRVDDDIEGFLGEELYRLAYTVHPYRWPTIGWMADIHAITTDDARAFYRTYYAPNNATIVLVGDFDAHAAEEMIERHYGALPPSVIPEEAIAAEPEQTAERRARFAKPVAAERLHMGWRGCGLTDEDHAAIEVAVDLLAGGQSSRLHRRLVIETEVASTAHLWAPEFRDPGLIELRLVLQRGHDAAEAEAIVDEEIDRLAHHAPDGSELEKAKNRIETQHWRSLRPQDGKAEALGHYETTGGDFRRLFSVAARVRAVDGAAVMRVVARYFARARRSLVVAAPPSRKRK